MGGGVVSELQTQACQIRKDHWKRLLKFQNYKCAHLYFDISSQQYTSNVRCIYIKAESMPRNWLNWILERENKEVVKSEANDKITSCEVTQIKESNKNSECLINNNFVETRNDRSSNRNSFVSIDSGIYSDVSDLDLSEDIEEECITNKLRDILQKIRQQRYLPSLRRNILNEAYGSLIIKADPYFEMTELYWAGGYDKEGRYHGKGILTYADEGFISGSWNHGER